MKGPSITARLAAGHRAYHLKYDQNPIFEDTAANWLMGPLFSVVLRVGLLRKLIWERAIKKTRPVSVFVVLRSRYTEDCLESFIADGCRQYMILGAGLDSWAIRNESSAVRVFELDHPETQKWKEDRIRSRLGALPSHLSLIPIDFEKATVAEVLSGREFDHDSPAFVSWLGTTYYLTRETIEATFVSLAKVCAPGSRVVFDYFQPKSTMSTEDLKLFELMDQDVTRRGEPLQTHMGPDDVRELMQSTGFRIIEDLSASEARQRYLHLRSDGLDIPGFVRLCCAEVTS